MTEQASECKVVFSVEKLMHDELCDIKVQLLCFTGNIKTEMPTNLTGFTKCRIGAIAHRT